MLLFVLDDFHGIWEWHWHNKRKHIQRKILYTVYSFLDVIIFCIKNSIGLATVASMASTTLGCRGSYLCRKKIRLLRAFIRGKTHGDARRTPRLCLIFRFSALHKKTFSSYQRSYSCSHFASVSTGPPRYSLLVFRWLLLHFYFAASKRMTSIVDIICSFE